MQMLFRKDRSEENSAFFVWMQMVALRFLDHLYLQKDQMFLWVPVLFACGIGVYFALPFEPPLFLIFVPYLFLICGFVFFKGRIASYVLVCVLIMGGGFVSAKMRSLYVEAPILNEAIGPVDVTGRISSLEKMEEGGARVILTDLSIEDVELDHTPYSVRLRLRSDEGARVGQRVKVLAKLNPPSGAIVPDGFDFRRYMYFQKVGAVGFIYNAPEIISDDVVYWVGIEQLRHIISERVLDVLDEHSGGIAVALMVGRRGGISDEDAQAIRDAGLAHMLAISGLHVGLLSGFVFFLVRFLLALRERWALVYPIKKVAAVFAFIGAVFYMLLAGGTVPTQRAVLTLAIVFLAVIMDRSPISLRMVAFSALVVLLFFPESLLSVSFQMSFAAVTALVYSFDVTRPYWSRVYSEASIVRRVAIYFVAVCFTTVIASIATAPFALYHFGQVSFIGSVANLIAVPLLAFIIMPFAFLSLFLMLFGVEYWPLQVVAFGIEQMLEISYWAAALPGAIIKMQAWSFLSFLFLVLAGLSFVLVRGNFKILSMLFVFASLFAAPVRLPNILISDSHKLFGFYDQDSRRLYVSSLRREKFIREQWMEYLGLDEDDVVGLRFKGGVSDKSPVCGEGGCRLVVNGYNVSYMQSSYGLKNECGWADVLIAVDAIDYDFRRDCRSDVLVGRFDTWREGSHFIYLGDELDVIKLNAQTDDVFMKRPWSMPAKKKD